MMMSLRHITSKGRNACINVYNHNNIGKIVSRNVRLADSRVVSGRAFSTIDNISKYDPRNTRSCAIIAHVDHGKTTMMDKLLAFCGTKVTGERAMDSNEHEKERGITIMSKYTRLYFKGHTLNIVDTPGHADFGGEVERILSMVDGVILLVDASEGPMSQTKFVLSKAIQNNKKAVVVLNKIDRDGHRAEEVESEIFELFCALTSKDELLEYPLMYASARQGYVVEKLDQVPGNSVEPLLDMIVKHFPSTNTLASLDDKFAMSVNTIQTDNHLGRIVTGKVEKGTISIGDKIKVLTREGNQVGMESKVTKLFYLEGMTRVDVNTSYAGEIISLAGCDGGVADTVCNVELTEPVATLPISPPVISMTFGPNDSPLSGREGNKLTSSMIKDRLQREIENNVTLSLRPSKEGGEFIDVQGRGELQIGILVETMRREGFEMTVSPPAVLAVVGEDKVRREPFEEVIVDIDPDLTGLVIESMSNRKGNLIEFKDIGNRSRLVFQAPSRGLMGFRHEIISATRGNATVNSIFSHYGEVNTSEFAGLRKGKLVSMETGKTSGYSLMSVEERGSLFVGVGEEVYEGMVIGENSKTGDLDVNPIKTKKLTNMRSTGAEEKVLLSPPKKMTVEEVISYMDEDEVLEVTPKSIRLRKRILESGARARWNKAHKKTN